MENEFRHLAYNEERAPELKGRWRAKAFEAEPSAPLDLEIGTGNGYHFAHYASQNPDRCLLGMELKYKPLIQAIRRSSSAGSTNSRICRFHAFNMEELFEPGELNHVIVHFPDPWVQPKKPRNRMMSRAFVETLYRLQKPGESIEFKTDSRVFFDWVLEELDGAPYEIEEQSFDLHRSPYMEKNFITGFEQIFIRKNIPINYLLLRKNEN